MTALTIFIVYPWLALLVAVGCVVLWRWQSVRTAVVASVLWVLYSAYEYLMHARVLCSGECNIRVDLLLIYPLLLGVTVFAIIRSLQVHRKRRARAT